MRATTGRKRATTTTQLRTAGQSVSVLLAKLMECHEPPDEQQRECLERVRRFHRWGRRNTIHRLRWTERAAPTPSQKRDPVSAGPPTLCRFVLELACCTSKEGPRWQVIEWGVDAPEVRFHPCSSHQVALRKFLTMP